MRLDLVLKQSGLIKRRTVAKTLSENGHIMINGKVSKPSSEVRDGDTLSLQLGARHVEVIIKYETKGKREIPTFEEVK